jgi:hypothetical protein
VLTGTLADNRAEDTDAEAIGVEVIDVEAIGVEVIDVEAPDVEVIGD